MRTDAQVAAREASEVLADTQPGGRLSDLAYTRILENLFDRRLPVGPRLIAVNDSVQTIKGKVAIASGPLIYAIESIDNPGLKDYTLRTGTPLMTTYRQDQLDGINIITGILMVLVKR